MAYYGFDPIIGVVKMSDIDPNGPGPVNLTASSPTYGRNVGYFEVMRGTDPVLGKGEFVYAKNNSGSTLTVGAVVQFAGSQDSSDNMIIGVTPWTGTANTGIPLGVAMAAVPNNQWGWFQVGGNAIVNTSGTVTANAPVYWEATGVVASTVVASKQVLNAQAVTANNPTLGSGSSAVTLSGQSVILLNRPFAQGAIT